MAHALTCSWHMVLLAPGIWSYLLLACGIFLDQGLNLCPPALAGEFFLPLSHQGSPLSFVKVFMLDYIFFEIYHTFFKNVSHQFLSSLSQNTGSFWVTQQPRQPDGLCLLPYPWLYTGDPGPGGTWDDRGRN